MDTSLQDIFWHLPKATAVLDRNLCYVAYSEKWCSVFEVETSLMGKSHYDVFPEIGEDWKQVHQDCLKGKSKKRDIDRFVRENGNVQWLQWDARPWFKDGKVAGLIMMSEDITQLKEAEEKLFNSEQLFEKFMSNTPILMWVKDSELKYTYVNDFFKDKFAMTDEDIIGKTDTAFMDPHNASYCAQSDQDALSSDTPVTSIERSFDTESFYEFLLTIKFRVPNKNGNTYLGGVGIDITDIKR